MTITTTSTNTPERQNNGTWYNGNINRNYNYRGAFNGQASFRGGYRNQSNRGYQGYNDYNRYQNSNNNRSYGGNSNNSGYRGNGNGNNYRNGSSGEQRIQPVQQCYNGRYKNRNGDTNIQTPRPQYQEVVTTETVQTRPGNNNITGGTTNTTSQSARTFTVTSRPTNRAVSCYVCGGPHFASGCPDRPNKASTGPQARRDQMNSMTYAPPRQSSMLVMTSDDSNTATDVLKNHVSIDSGQPAIVKLEIEGTPAFALFDSGSTVTCVSLDVIKQLSLLPLLQRDEHTKTIGHTTITEGHIDLKITAYNRSTWCRAHVLQLMPRKYDFILSRPDFLKLTGTNSPVWVLQSGSLVISYPINRWSRKTTLRLYRVSGIQHILLSTSRSITQIN
ncbi:hypothetical protein RvY_12109 [Ramazzottius varieornatus]|uniref:Uncharacterized protein n=1 Tax=Ramazzottius varieornatus TaxID=947166 RepID=A0A1D1VIA6_RAMVA|nr:hypothetical protein RvY_12109 [Ramazzottius varieornatus]